MEISLYILFDHTSCQRSKPLHIGFCCDSYCDSYSRQPSSSCLDLTQL
jgi:hypothetical protein